MIDRYEETVRKTVESFLTFPETLFFPAGEEGAFREALRRDARVLYYIDTFWTKKNVAGTRMLFSYRNLDFPTEDVNYVRNEEDAEGLMRFYASCFCPSFVLVLPKEADIKRAYRDFIDNYASFYANLTRAGYTSTTYREIGYQCCTVTFKYRIAAYKLREMERLVNIELDAVSRKLFLPSMTAQEKAYIAHNYLAKVVTYTKRQDIGAEELCVQQSAYGALVEKRCVCQGYAEAYKRLMDLQGIECYVVCGRVHGSATDHAWNMIGFNGKEYFHVDVTWDSLGNGRGSDAYFGGSDAEFAKERDWKHRPHCVATGKTDLRGMARFMLSQNAARYMRAGINQKYLYV